LVYIPQDASKISLFGFGLAKIQFFRCQVSGEMRYPSFPPTSPVSTCVPLGH